MASVRVSDTVGSSNWTVLSSVLLGNGVNPSPWSVTFVVSCSTHTRSGSAGPGFAETAGLSIWWPHATDKATVAAARNATDLQARRFAIMVVSTMLCTNSSVQLGPDEQTRRTFPVAW